MLIDALVQVAARKTKMTCIAQVTFEMINKILLVYDRRLDFTYFEISLDLMADENRLDGVVDFLVKVAQKL